MPALSEPYNSLRRIKRGLAGYVSYLAACEVNEAFSEYVLYEPIVRILMAMQYHVESEVKCPNVPQPPRQGDKKKLDFTAVGHGFVMAIEVKWAREKVLNIEKDMEKLNGFCQTAGNRGYLCVFGVESIVKDLSFEHPFANAALAGVWLYEVGSIVTASFGQTAYSCRIWEIA